jgi:hypothetical protein
MRLAAAIGIVGFVCCAAPAQASDDVVDGLVQALVLVCLPSQVTGTPVETILDEAGPLAKSNPPIETKRLPIDEEKQWLKGRPGKVFLWGPARKQGFIVSQGNSCQVTSTFPDGAKVAKSWEKWLVGPKLPFKVTKRDGDHVASMTYYHGKVGARSLVVVIAHRNPPSKYGVTATIVVGGYND